MLLHCCHWQRQRQQQRHCHHHHQLLLLTAAATMALQPPSSTATASNNATIGAVGSSPPLPPSTRTAANKDHHCCHSHQLPPQLRTRMARKSYCHGNDTIATTTINHHHRMTAVAALSPTPASMHHCHCRCYCIHCSQCHRPRPFIPYHRGYCGPPPPPPPPLQPLPLSLCLQHAPVNGWLLCHLSPLTCCVFRCLKLSAPDVVQLLTLLLPGRRPLLLTIVSRCPCSLTKHHLLSLLLLMVVVAFSAHPAAYQPHHQADN